MPEKAPKPIPDGMHTITTHLWFNGNCKEAIPFYKKAFGAKEVAPPVPTEDGKAIMHVILKIGDSNIMMADAWPEAWEQGPHNSTSAGLWVYVEDCDGAYKQSIDAGCEAIKPMADACWGDRFGKVKDPFGHCWAIASHKWIMSLEEIQERQQEWLKSFEW